MEANYFLAYIDRHFYLTGSRVIGGSTEKSDWDYVLLAEDYDSFVKKYDLLHVEYECDGSCHRFFTSIRYLKGNLADHRSHKDINFIIVQDSTDLAAWQYATEETRAYLSTSEIDLIHKRKDIFGKFLTNFYYTNVCDCYEAAKKEWGEFTFDDDGQIIYGAKAANNE